MMTTTKSTPVLLLVAAISVIGIAEAFSSGLTHRSVSTGSTQLHSSRNNDPTRGKNGKIKFGQRTVTESSRFLSDFRTANGEIIDPYRALRVPRSATLDDIKTSYRKLSRKLHPDAVSKSKILPGNCANLDEVREEWEKVAFSYEILSNPKSRKSYDRNSSVAEVLEDPGGAVGRAVVGGAFTAVGMGFGAMWKVGELAVKGVTAVAQPSTAPAPARKEATGNVKKAQTNIKSEAPSPTANKDAVDVTDQARVWTLEEMRAAASNAAATGAASKKQTTETIPITFDSNKAGTPIVRKEGPPKSDSHTSSETKTIPSPAENVKYEGIKMITPEPIISTTKSGRKKPRVKRGGKGFGKK